MRIYYLRDKRNVRQKLDGSFTKGNPVCIIASEIDREHNVIRYAIATVHPKDHFVKRRGLAIVAGRLLKQPIVINGCPQNGHDIMKKIVNHIFANDYQSVPPAAKEIVINWLCDASKPREERHYRV